MIYTLVFWLISLMPMSHSISYLYFSKMHFRRKAWRLFLLLKNFLKIVGGETSPIVQYVISILKFCFYSLKKYSLNNFKTKDIIYIIITFIDLI